MTALDVAPRIFEVVRALVQNPGAALTDALGSVAGGAVAEVQRIEAEARRLAEQASSLATEARDAAAAAVDAARAEAAATVAMFGAKADEARAAVDAAIAEGERAVSAARQQADRLRASALAAAVDQTERQRIEEQAGRILGDAQESAEAARRAAAAMVDSIAAELAERQAELTATVTRLEDAAAQAATKAQQLLDTVDERVQQEVARLTEAAEALIGQATALPGKAVALAEDARNQLVDAIGQEVSLVGLITQALVYLKREMFPDVDGLQVVAYRNDDDEPGIGLSWVDGDVEALVAYVPDQTAGTLVINTKREGGGPIALTAGNTVSVALSASGNQDIVLPLGSRPAPTGDGHATLTVGFDTSSLRLDQRFVQAQAGAPGLSLTLRSAGGAWHYRVGAELRGAGWTVDFARLLAPIPNLLPMPGLGELRTYGFTLEDGLFSFTEEHAA